MILRVINHSFHYEMENLCRVFYPYEKIKVVRDYDGENEIVAVTRLEDENTLFVSLKTESFDSFIKKEDNQGDDLEKSMATMLFELMKKATGYTPKWGILTGVRPSKLMNSLISTEGEDGAKQIFTNDLLVTEQKTELAYRVAKAEKRIMDLTEDNSFSLYISIPFCPTRCNYCSFVSHSVDRAGKLLPEYVDNLCDELALTGKIAKDLGLRLESVYWGGGTPTTLSARQLAKTLKAVENSFDLSYCREYTVEAGRADTVTEDKLRELKAAGVGRISINPQTFNDEVLANIGRRHTVQDVLDAYALARKIGFDNINMDLIAGLTGDSSDSFNLTVDKSVELEPESITLHTLALKRSSNLVTHGEAVESGEVTNKMLEYAQSRFYSGGYKPYYMYRQSRSLGNLENVGWCKPGFECLYNVFMMEECHTVLAVGAGAVTKLKEPQGKNIERIFNFKYPYEYNSGFDEIKSRKQYVYDFYKKYGKANL